MGTIILVVIWIWGAYKGWNMITGKNEWLDKKETTSYIVKGAICVVLGAVFGLCAIGKFAFKLASTWF